MAKALGIYDGDGRPVMADKIQPSSDSKAYAIPLNQEKWVAEFLAPLSIQNLTFPPIYFPRPVAVQGGHESTPAQIRARALTAFQSAAVSSMPRVKYKIRPQFGQVVISACARQVVTICVGSFMWQPPQALCSTLTTTFSPLLLNRRS